MKRLIAALALVLLADPAFAEEAPADAEVQVPIYAVLRANASFPTYAVRDQGMQRDGSILVGTVSKRWYRVTLHGGCTEAWPGASVGFTSFGGVVDRSSTAIVGGQACPVRAIDEIETPPDRVRRPAQTAEDQP